MGLREVLLTIQCITIFALFTQGWIAFKRLRGPLHVYLLLSSIAAFLNNLGYLLQLLSKTKEGYLAALKFSYLGRNIYAFFVFLFCAELVHVKLPELLKKTLMIIHIALYIVIFTVEYHGLYYKSMSFEAGGVFPKLIHENGPVHHINMALQLIYVVIALIWIFMDYRREKKKLAKKRLASFSVAVIVQGSFLVIQLIGVPGLKGIYDVTMIGYCLGTLIMLISILTCDLLGTTEIARDFVMDRITEGIIAVDSEGVILYYNETAGRLYPGIRNSIGISVDKDPQRVSDTGAKFTVSAIRKAVENNDIIKINDRIYTPEENDLIYQGENYGKLYALVDDTEHYRYMEELKEQREIAEHANAAKSRFLANMSHEIRTPINAVLGMDEMILRETGEPSTRLYAADIMSAGRTLLSIINDILDLSKVEEGKMEIIPVQYELSSLINDLVNMIRERADRKGLILNIEVDEHIPHLLYGDEIRVRQCVLNLLTNAVKYTEKGSVTLKVYYEKTDDAILLGFTVEDTGIGMKKEDMEKLFVPFERIEEKRNRSIEGTGLGMSIVRQLLDLMGTSLRVESEYGKGSVFSFVVKQEVVKWEEIGSYEQRYDRAKGSASDYHELFHAPDARILVVDDTEINLTVVKSLLKKTLIRIDTTMSGREALCLAAENEYDAVFIDHMMPDMDGIETLKQMRMSGLNQNTPAVVLTANAVSGAREMYLDAGFNDYLSKPVDGIKLEKLLKSLIPEDKQQAVESVFLNGSGDKAAADPSQLNDLTKISTQMNSADDLPAWLYEISGINVETGLANCGSEEGYMSVLTVFHQTAATKADEIETLYREGDIPNYTIKVHALKSSARIIGAAELSALAEKLEKAGKENDLAFIKDNQEMLLSMYRALDDRLLPLDGAEETLPGIEQTALKEAYRTIYEIAKSMDYGLMEELLKDLRGYRLPPHDADNMKTIEKALTELDWDSIIQITDPEV